MKFDDLKITHTKTNIIQYNEYYPFGLQASTSWTRDQTTGNNYLYNEANELNPTTGWYETFFRNYDPAIGRFTSVDPLAAKYASESSYNYAFNNPVLFNDPMGAEGEASGQDLPEYIYGPHGYTDDNGNWHWNDPTGDAAAYAAMGMGHIYDAQQWTNGYIANAQAQMAAQNKAYLQATGQLINLELWEYEGGTIVDGEKIADEHYYFWQEAQQGGPYSGVEISMDGLRQYLAIVAGESGNNIDEASAIGSVILNRLVHKGANMQGDFVSKIGGKGQYDAIGGKIYNEIMALSNSDLLHIINNPLSLQGKYSDRIMGAMGPITNGVDYSQGAYFWNASSPQTGFNWNQYNNGTFVQTTSYGGTTFFRYADGKGRTWP